jgi:signal transduction histidine kinase
MNRPRVIWLGFSLCLIVLLGATGWMTWTALRLESYQQQIRNAESTEERLRLSLWRMDSLMAPIIAQEVALPWDHDTLFHASNNSSPQASIYPPGSIPEWSSPLLTETTTNILLHFQFSRTGPILSPECPPPSARTHAATATASVSAAKIPLMEQRLKSFETLMAQTSRSQAGLPNSQVLFQQLPPLVALANSGNPGNSYTLNNAPQQTVAKVPSIESNQQMVAQYAMNQMEFKNRAQNINAAVNFIDNNNPTIQRKHQKTPENLQPGAMQALWIGDALVLARRARIDGIDHVQGCWIDWTGLSNTLTASIRDLWPDGTPRLVPDTASDPKGHNLAALPVRLIPIETQYHAATEISPVRILLCIAWAGMILATLAVAVLLYGVVSLSERRAMFVSAVTHELRTPLTTFKLYSEMLAEGMVRNEADRAQYLKTLRAEADRLGHLIENVLAFSRLERGSARASVETLELSAFLDRVLPRLEDRAAQAGLKLLTDRDPTAGSSLLRIDTTSVEQILFNLMDNACKYASNAPERLLHLESALAETGEIVIRVRDHGPGLCADALKNLFQPFGKSAQRAANGAPGVGLGLALSRRLSRSLGGSLTLTRTGPDGTTFELRLPVINPIPPRTSPDAVIRH